MSWNEWSGQAGSFIRNVNNGAADFMCQLWNLYPDRWTKNQKLLGGNMIESYFRNFCNDNPPPPQTPFNGGQCVGVDYNFRVSYKPDDATPFIEVVVGENEYNPGPISDLKMKLFTQVDGNIVEGLAQVEGVSNRGFFVLYWKQNGVPAEQRFGYTGIFENAIGKFLGIVRNDGQPDNCGNPPVSYPPSNPPPPGGDTYNIDITAPDGTDFTFPLVHVDNDFNFPITFNVQNNPEINIDIDFDGINIDFGPSPTSPDGSPKFTGPGNNPTSSPTENPDLNDRLPPKPINPNDYDGTPGEPTEDEDKEDPEITYVTIDITQLPFKDKRILLPNPEDTVFFAGYFCWTVNDRRTVEYPIRKLHTVWVKPTWATGFAAYAVNGAMLKIDTYKKKGVVS